MELIILAAGGSEVQQIPRQKGWNWTSFNIFLKADATGVINNVMTAAEPWEEGDQIKNPVTRNSCIYDEEKGAFLGGLYHFSYIYCHMVYSKKSNMMRVSGETLPVDSMHVKLRGETWSPLPCFYQRVTPIKEALADYYDHAMPEDLIKAHDRFATFSQDRKWVGNLTVLRPGEGYFFKRIEKGDVDIRFYNTDANSAPAPRALPAKEEVPAFSNPHAATNMTMIAKIEGLEDERITGIEVFMDDELVGKATPIQFTNDQLSTKNGKFLYFLTIQSNRVGKLNFRTAEGQSLIVKRSCSDNGSAAKSSYNVMVYEPDAHYGSLKSPVFLIPDEPNRVYKVIEDDKVLIIRNNEKYTITGVKVQ